MTFDELLQEVYLLTNRPDLVAETKSAVKAATLKAHRSDFFSKDIYETGVSFTESTYRQQLDITSLISNYRAFKYVRRVEDETDENGAFFDILTPTEMLDSYGIQKPDVAYVAGRILELRAAVNFQHALIGVYVSPIVVETDYASWIAILQPFAIIYEAARVVSLAIGFADESKRFGRLLAEEYQELAISNTLDVGS